MFSTMMCRLQMTYVIHVTILELKIFDELFTKDSDRPTAVVQSNLLITEKAKRNINIKVPSEMFLKRTP